MKRVSMVSMLVVGVLITCYAVGQQQQQQQRAAARGVLLDQPPADMAGYRVVFEFEGREYVVLSAVDRSRFSLNQSTTVSGFETTAGGKTEKNDKAHDRFNVNGVLRSAAPNTITFDYQLNVQRKTTSAEVDGDGADTGRREQEDVNFQMTGSIPVHVNRRTVLAELPGKPLTVTIEPMTD